VIGSDAARLDLLWPVAASASAADAAGVLAAGVLVSREAQSSAARRTDQAPAVSPSLVRSAGSGVSVRRAARRARLGGSGSGSLEAIGCETHDGVPPAGRVGRPELASSGAV
jgi:hypothetical protein